MKISACIITLNEEDNLPRCLVSLRDTVDEVVVVDSGSTDATRLIAKRHGARVVEHAWAGFVAQKNLAISQARHPWVLSIDADEELSPGLATELKLLRQRPPADPPAGYEVCRLVQYQDRWIWHGDWFPDILVRLFQKEKARFTGGRVHERLELDGPAERLTGYMHHYTYRDEADRDARIAKYAKLWALTAHERGKRAWPWDPPLHAAVRFLRGYLLRRGFLDGPTGYHVAAGNAREVRLKYRLLREMNASGDA